MNAPEYTDLPSHERLRAAIEKGAPGASFDAKLTALRNHVMAQGVTGHHAAPFTLTRWVTGRGKAPPYWLALAADFLGVSYRWLAEGDGVLPAGVKMPKEQAPVAMRPAKPKAGAPAPPEPPLPTGPEPEVSIPKAEDVHATSSRVIADFLAQTMSKEAVQAILDHEPTNPDYKGGRKTVLKEAEKRLAALSAG